MFDNFDSCFLLYSCIIKKSQKNVVKGVVETSLKLNKILDFPLAKSVFGAIVTPHEIV